MHLNDCIVICDAGEGELCAIHESRIRQMESWMKVLSCLANLSSHPHVPAAAVTLQCAFRTHRARGRQRCALKAQVFRAWRKYAAAESLVRMQEAMRIWCEAHAKETVRRHECGAAKRVQRAFHAFQSRHMRTPRSRLLRKIMQLESSIDHARVDRDVYRRARSANKRRGSRKALHPKITSD